MRKKWSAIILLFFLIGVGAACHAAVEDSSTKAGTPVQFEIEMRDDVRLVGDDVMISQADAIFLGRIDWVSPAMEADYPTHHQLAVTVLQPIVDEVNIGSGGILTVAGPSPLKKQDAPSTAAMQRDNLPSHNLKVGDEAIFFVKKSQLRQNDSLQLVLTPFSDMSQSVLSADLLDDLILQVQQQRPLLVKPVSSDDLGTY